MANNKPSVANTMANETGSRGRRDGGAPRQLSPAVVAQGSHLTTEASPHPGPDPTYRYRDRGKRQVYMREYMRRKRSGAPST